MPKQSSKELASLWESRTDPPLTKLTRRASLLKAETADGPPVPGKRWEVRLTVVKPNHIPYFRPDCFVLGGAPQSRTVVFPMLYPADCVLGGWAKVKRMAYVRP